MVEQQKPSGRKIIEGGGVGNRVRQKASMYGIWLDLEREGRVSWTLGLSSLGREYEKWSASAYADNPLVSLHCTWNPNPLPSLLSRHSLDAWSMIGDRQVRDSFLAMDFRGRTWSTRSLIITGTSSPTFTESCMSAVLRHFHSRKLKCIRRETCQTCQITEIIRW